MPPSYVKGYVKRSKNDAADAAAICEAVTRPSMRFVPIKSTDQQALLMLHRTRDLLIRQRTQLINALRAHLAEFGLVAETGREGLAQLGAIITDESNHEALLSGPNNTYIATLVERQTRYVMLAKVAGKDTRTVVTALIKQAKKLPKELYKSLTRDRGKELTAHRRFTLATNIEVYFCDPQSPWQRGSNENTNGLLRQYFPQGTDLSVHSQAHLNKVARQLKPERLAGDTAYGAAPMLNWLVEEKGIAPHIPVFDRSKRDDGTFSRSDFQYDPTSDVYHCPAGKTLTTTGTLVNGGTTLIYLARKRDCDDCKLRAQCCPKVPFRKIPRDQHEAARDIARSLAGTEAFEQSRQERKKIEMRFAHLKRILRLGRLRLRGPRGAQDEFVLAAIAQNLRRLASLVARPPPSAVRCIA